MFDLALHFDRLPGQFCRLLERLAGHYIEHWWEGVSGVLPPQGVMLSHANIAYQVANFSSFVTPAAGEQTLSLLPPWHIYERTVSYDIFSRGCKQVTTCSL